MTVKTYLSIFAAIESSNPATLENISATLHRTECNVRRNLNEMELLGLVRKEKLKRESEDRLARKPVTKVIWKKTVLI